MSANLSRQQIESRLRIVDEHIRAENEHDVDRIMETFGTQPVFVLNGHKFDSHESIRGMYDTFGFGGSGGFDNIHVDVKRRHLSDDAVILEAVLTAEHSGAWEGIPATGRSVEVPLCAVFPFDDDGKLAGERVYLDGALLLAQLGVLS